MNGTYHQYFDVALTTIKYRSVPLPATDTEVARDVALVAVEAIGRGLDPLPAICQRIDYIEAAR